MSLQIKMDIGFVYHYKVIYFVINLKQLCKKKFSEIKKLDFIHMF